MRDLTPRVSALDRGAERMRQDVRNRREQLCLELLSTVVVCCGSTVTCEGENVVNKFDFAKSLGV